MSFHLGGEQKFVFDVMAQDLQFGEVMARSKARIKKNNESHLLQKKHAAWLCSSLPLRQQGSGLLGASKEAGHSVWEEGACISGAGDRGAWPKPAQLSKWSLGGSAREAKCRQHTHLPLPIQLSVHAPTEVAEVAAQVCGPVTHVGDPEGLPDAWLQRGPEQPKLLPLGGVNHPMEKLSVFPNPASGINF